MSKFEVILAVIWAIIVLIIVGIPLFLLIAGLVKNEIDKVEKESMGIVGWIIAILITCAIFYALFFADECNIEHFRHT
ncbi:hypothetical protein SAMN05216518_10952 [Bacteroidales bacterium KHT7]|nr:hypothetical protein SAMN05216518_10952 [Bacteroidales bacterium KHT7]